MSNIWTTCHQAISQFSQKLKFVFLCSGMTQGTAANADQAEQPTPGGETTAHTGVQQTGGG
jgi:hypothetical protein